MEMHITIMFSICRMLQGESLVTFIFRKLNFPYDYGSLAFFDIVAISTLFMAILFWIAKASVYMERFKRKHVKKKGEGNT